MKHQNLTGRKELGEFCDQFAYEPGIKYPNKTRKISHRKSTKPYRKKSYHKTSHPKPTKKFYPKKSTSKPKGKSKSEVKCYKCGQTGHYANRCRSKAKSKVNELNLDPDIKNQLIQALEAEEISTEDEIPSDDELNQLYSSSSDEDDPEEPCP
ncbi:uncharacterized protein LOC114293584 [Camellia sinensis]|uniref:uncharacterized protein LOC114293584 n=1 Tax=Camellia sinensis TaxID=4442 RepID=UPI001036B44B|nr:uncharacterized protein LOC114293584 [Camellia sinensis]